MFSYVIIVSVSEDRFMFGSGRVTAHGPWLESLI